MAGMRATNSIRKTTGTEKQRMMRTSTPLNKTTSSGGKMKKTMTPNKTTSGVKKSVTQRSVTGTERTGARGNVNSNTKKKVKPSASSVARRTVSNSKNSRVY